MDPPGKSPGLAGPGLACDAMGWDGMHCPSTQPSYPAQSVRPAGISTRRGCYMDREVNAKEGEQGREAMTEGFLNPTAGLHQTTLTLCTTNCLCAQSSRLRSRFPDILLA